MLLGEVNAILIAELRNKVLAKIEESNSDSFHELDIQRIQNDNSWLRRFILHHEYDMELAFQMVMDCLKWRKEFGVHDIKESNLPQNFFEAHVIYPYSRDKEECKTLMFHIRFYHKDPQTTPDMKRFLIYWMEKMDVDEKGHPITVIFDMKDTGFSNMDMDFVKFFISLFKFYYPSFLGYLLVYELPWILNTAWKLVKTWLSARAVEKVKFVNKNTIQDYINVDQLPVTMGGTNTFQYVYEPLEEQDIFTNLQDQNGPALTPKKKVHFAETDTTEDTTKRDVENFSSTDMRCNSQRDDVCYTGRLLRINPADELTFNADGSKEPCSTITLTNNAAQCVAFKVKTTSPEKYRVRPSSGIIRPNCQCEVVVQLQSLYQASCLVRDKFLVMAIALEHAEVSSQELGEIWRLTPKERIMEYKLRCSLASNCPNIYGCAETTQCCPVSGASDHTKTQLDRLTLQVDCLLGDVRCLRWLLNFVLGLLLFLIIFLAVVIRFGFEPFLLKKTIVNSCVGANVA